MTAVTLVGLLFNTALAAAQPIHAASPQSLIEKGHFLQARAIIEERYRTNPKNPETLWLMSWIRQEFHDLKASLDFAEKALAVDPKNALYHLRVASAAGESAEKANYLKKFTLGRRFKKEVDATLQFDPNNIEALHMLMEYYLQAPSIMGGDKGKARAIPDRIMRIDPVQGCFAQIRLAGYDKQQNRIESLHLKAVELRPESYDAHRSLAGYYNGAMKFAIAEKHAREAIHIDPNQVSAHIILAQTLVEQKKWTELDLALREAEKAIPDNKTPYYAAVALSCWRNYELQNAELYIRKYLGQEPEPNMAYHPNAHRILGHILYKAGRKNEGIAELKLAAQLDPNSPAKEELKTLK
jgi:tetratricopeptide (TPR) repeat protein